MECRPIPLQKPACGGPDGGEIVPLEEFFQEREVERRKSAGRLLEFLEATNCAGKAKPIRESAFWSGCEEYHAASLDSLCAEPLPLWFAKLSGEVCEDNLPPGYGEPRPPSRREECAATPYGMRHTEKFQGTVVRKYPIGTKRSGDEKRIDLEFVGDRAGGHDRIDSPHDGRQAVCADIVLEQGTGGSGRPAGVQGSTGLLDREDRVSGEKSGCLHEITCFLFCAEKHKNTMLFLTKRQKGSAVIPACSLDSPWG